MHLLRRRPKPDMDATVPDYPLLVVDRPALSRLMASQRCTTSNRPEEPTSLVVEYPKEPTDMYPGPLLDAGCRLIRSIQERALLRAVVGGRPTFEQTWLDNPRFRAALLAHDDPQNVAKWALRRTFNYVIPSLFIPCVARTFYDEFSRILCRHDLRVLDPSCGWGDRLAGAYCSGVVREYVGTDPNSDLFAGYAEIQRLMEPTMSEMSAVTAAGGDENESKTATRARTTMVATIIMQRFEVAAPLLQAASFDVVFTSPPFFDYEVYSPHNPTYTDWNQQFYEPLVSEAFRLVKPDGIIAFHMDDTSAGQVPPAIAARSVAKFAVDVGFGKRKIAVWILQRGGPEGEDVSAEQGARKRPRSPEA